MNFTKPKKAIGLDIGTHAVKAVQMSRSGGGLAIDNVGYALVDHNQVNVDPVSAQADALREALRRISCNNSMLVGALPGQTVVIRYPRLRETSPDQIGEAIQKEAAHNIPYELSEVFLDWSLLSEENEGSETLMKVLLVAAKNEVIDTRIQIASAADVTYNSLSVDSLALADAAEGCDLLKPDETIALINVGASSVSIHFTKDGVSNFIRDISWGARELISAISKSRRCDYEEAEAILYNYDKEVEASQETVEAEPVVEAIDEAPPEPHSEGSSLLDPLSDELDSLDEAPRQEPVSAAPEMVDETPLSEILTAPISRLVAEVRRSFDYYEHQLYERPVDRIILSGGVAHIPQIREALTEDTAIEDVATANLTDGPIRIKGKSGVPEFDEYPAQFMVAVGLAARGVSEL